MDVNDNASFRDVRVALGFFASRLAPTGFMCTRIFLRTHMKNDNLRADRDDLDDLDHFTPRATAKQRGNNLVMQVAAGVFLGGLALWLVQLGATALYAKLMLGTITFGG
jgi:hypothetical protein